MSAMMDDSLISDFLDESGTLLDRLNEDLLALDTWVGEAAGASQTVDQQLVNNMFRSAHSIKGLSGMLGLSRINQITHKIENVFDAVRKEQLAVERDVVESMFTGLDTLAALIENLRSAGNDELNCEAALNSLAQVLQAAGCEKQATSQADAERQLAELAAAAAAPMDAPVAADPLAGVANESEISPKYLGIFVDETETSLDQFSESLLNGAATENESRLETLLCTAHRIKGSAASIGLNRPARLAHLMEDHLQSLREHQQPISPALTDALLAAADALRAFVVQLRTGATQGDGFAQAAQALSALPLAGKSAVVRVAETEPVALPPVTPPAFKFEDAWLANWRKQLGPSRPAVAAHVEFTPLLAMAGLKAQLILEKLGQLGDVVHCDPSAQELDEITNLKSLQVVVATEESPESVSRRLAISGVAWQQTLAVPFQNAMPAVAAVAAPKLPASASSNEPTLAVAAAAAAQSESKTPAPADSAKANETLRVDIERLDQLMNLAGQLVINRARFSRLDQRLREAQPGKRTAQVVSNLCDLAQRLATDSDLAATSGRATDLEAVRNHARRLQTDLAIVQQEIGQLSNLRSRINELGDAVHQLNRVTEGIQKSVMDTRMVPIGPLFTRFKRVIRDITRLNNKQIELVIRGEKTELDKRMIDELGDPLIHMVRNSADHGIESPEDRERACKPRQGTITLDAFHRGNSIVVQVHDDGKGLDQKRILAKAIERNLLTPADAEKLTPHEIYQLIWEPGFSTAEKVTEISGRGMGMDIVRSKIEELSGVVELTSEPGRGSTFTIRLPLTLAILPSLMTRIDGDVFALPIETVVEIVSCSKADLRTVHGLRTAQIRGRVVSLVHLGELFDWRQPARQTTRDNDTTTLVIVSIDRREIGLAVDAVLGEEDIVIKSLAENYRNVPGIAGASILGDGSVSLILDVPALIDLSTRLTRSPLPV